MFEDIIFFLVFFIVSYLFYNVIFCRDLGPFKTPLNILGFIGVFIHELSHALLCVLCGIHVKEFSVKYRGGIRGHVAIKDWEQESFLQAAIDSLAPLYVCTWLFFWFLEIAFDISQVVLFRVIAGFLCISVIIGAGPSNADFQQVYLGFKKDPSYAMYQVLLVVISSAITFFVLVHGFSTEFHNAINYLIIGGVYIALKYTIKGINYLGRAIFSRKAFILRQVDYKTYTKRSLKPKSSRESGKSRNGVW